ncbi:magnesium/cobalt transporter CorA [Alicyclobacillus fodiniaquatilis]|jgi:magnesium transporter|uniref:Magnesium transport protein CorA n=1 Tax=Alicyclobacillus fodiniaquatilis TaxID=1661150 RepID=A0ABW4JDN7_9BACL
MIKTYFYEHENEIMHHDVDLTQVKRLLADERNLLWVDLFDWQPRDLQWLGRMFSFHALAIEDCIYDSPRSKVDRYDGYDFFELHALRYNEDSDPEITSEELNVFLGKNYVVTVHKKPIASIGRIADVSRKTPHYMTKGPDYLLYAIVDGITDTYFPIMERISARIDELEVEIYEHPALAITEEFLSLKRTIVMMRRAIAPQRRIFSNIGTRYTFDVRKENLPYYMDLTDHLERVSDSIEVFRDLVSSALETYSSYGTAKTNEAIRVLTIITTLTATLTLITGIFGMNVPLPWQKSWWSTLVIAAVMVGLSLWMVRAFRKRNWI